MTKQSNVHSENIESLLDKTKVIPVGIENEMKKSFIAYAMAVNVSRAIPDVRDGLKPVQRRILYSMSELGLDHTKPYRKCARIVGDVLGKYHPHGDSAVYMALVRMAQDFSMREILIDGHGNFGSIDGDPPAAQRYTEARLSRISGELLRDIEKETVDFYPNFDDTLQQPTVLPARFPNLLVNGSDGIAVGMATNIPPHNLGEVINGAVALLENSNLTIDELMSYIPGPDFPTGGVIMGRTGIRRAYKTGRGGITVRAKCEIEEYGHNRDGIATKTRIVVTEIPFQVNKADLIEQIADLVKNKKIEGILDIREESDRKGMRIVMEVKRDAQASVVLNMLYKHSALQFSGGITFLALVDGEPKILNLKEMLQNYLAHRKEVIVRRTRFELNKAQERAHIVEGLVIALANIDEVVAIIKKSRERQDAAENLMKAFELTEKQAGAILDMRLQRLTSLEVEKLNEELLELQRTIAELKSILASPEKVRAIIKEELLEVKENYASPRRTEISPDMADIETGDLIEQEDVVISMTHHGYIKRMPVSEYRAQRRGGKGVTAHRPKDEDFVNNIFVSNTHDDLLFFTNKGKVYSIKCYEVPEAGRAARGRAIVNLLRLDEDEKVNAIIDVKSYDEGNLIMATKSGLIKKTPLSEFSNIRKVGKVAISLLPGDELIGVELTKGNNDILVASTGGKCIRFSEDEVRAMGRSAQGVKSMELEDGEYIVDMTLLKEGNMILTVSQKGFGKRTGMNEYRCQNRGGKGIKAGIFSDKTGGLVNLKQIGPGQDIMLITDNGTMIRMPADDIPVIGRNTQGVMLMRTDEDCNVVSVAVIEDTGEDKTRR